MLTRKCLCQTNMSKLHALSLLSNAYAQHYMFSTEHIPEQIGRDDSKYEKKDSSRKVNHSMLMAYSGSKYIGMQYQKDTTNATVEGALFAALLDNKWINKAEYYQPKRIKYQHASRTDKGVSAARQCCSLLLPEGLDVQVINNNLPEDIRIFGLKRVTDNFNSRRFCTERTYSYTLPTIAFSQYNDQTSQKSYRLPSNKLKQVNELLQQYKGSKNFHNFTVDKTYGDRSCLRQMTHLECGSPFLFNDVEFCVISIRGRSFMMHQIRKMIGLLLAVTREVIDPSIFDSCFTDSLINCPTAPALGLVLDRQHYDEYDRNYGSNGYEKLTWEEYDDQIQQFRKKYIQSTIFKTEIESQPMLEWLETLLNYCYVPESVIKSSE